MITGAPPRFILLFFLGASSFGLITTLAIALRPPTINDGTSWRRPLIGLIFTVVCTLGITVAFFPQRCSGKFRIHEAGEQDGCQIRDLRSGRPVKGHHPSCGKFSGHVILFRHRFFCAACTGLSLGALIALLGTVSYFFWGWGPQQLGFPSVLLGQTGIVLGFIQLRFKGFYRSTLNALFVLGGCLILVGMDMLAEDMFVDLYLISLVVLWVWTRILLSQWDHSRICRACKADCRLKESRGLVSSP